MKARAIRMVQGLAYGLGCLVLLVFALALAGALIPGLPVLGSIGPLLISPFGTWMVLLSLFAVAVGLLRWRRGGSRLALALAIVAGVCALGIGGIDALQIAVARTNGLDIDLPRTLWFGSVPHTSAPPVLADYGEYGGQPLSLAVYRPPARADARPAPVLVYVHGGGWGAGTLHDRVWDMRWFADRGYLVVSVDYTLSTAMRHPWAVASPEIGCALVWIGANAGRFGGDPTRLALFGESAGGNLVLNVAYMAAAGRLQPACPGQPPRIAAVIAPYPVLDAVGMYRNTDVIAGPFARQMTIHYTGGTPAQYPERYAAVSTPTYIAPGAPPTLLMPGLADHLLSPAIAFGFARQAGAAGIETRVIAFPYGEHSFDQMSGSIGDQLVRQATLQFLAQHGLSP